MKVLLMAYDDVAMGPQTGVLRFEVYELDALAGELRKAGIKLKIQPQPLKVLAYLASRPGKLVTREELREAIWGSETFVDFEQGLNYCIRQIRAVLGEDGNHTKFIETLPKRGYRFVAAVERELADSQEARPARWKVPKWQVGVSFATVGVALAILAWVRADPGRPREATVAVLAFADLSVEEDTEYFAHGLTEELMSRLSGVEGIRVVGRASAFALPPNSDIRQAAERLGVRNVLTGSVRAQGDQVRVTVQLVDTQDDLTMWSQSYDRNLADVLAVQEGIANSVASALKERFGIQGMEGRPLNRPSNLEAYNLYLRALYVGRKVTKPALTQGLEMLERVIQLEPGFAAAHAQLANFNIQIEICGLSGWDSDRLNRARIAALTAAELDQHSADAQMVLGYAAMRQFQWKEARVHLEKALQLNPNHSRARNLRAAIHVIHGEIDQGLLDSQRAVEADPLSLMANRDRGLYLYLARRFDDALQTLEDTQRLDPEFSWAYYTSAFVHLQKGNCLAAIESAKKHSGLVGLPTSVLPLAIAKCYGPEAGRKALEKFITATGPYTLAPAVRLAIGDRERALEELESAAKRPAASLWFVGMSPEYDDLRGEPRFQAVLRKLGLEETP